ncbi:pentatricopeptide repeat-containing protein 1, mitochondrial-like isoform 2-T2 [Rhinophrynus dorsalis]
MRFLHIFSHCLLPRSLTPWCLFQSRLMCRTAYGWNSTKYLIRSGLGTVQLRTNKPFISTPSLCQVLSREKTSVPAIERDHSKSDTGPQVLSEDKFGILSEKYSSRAVFKKTSPELQNLRYVEEEVEETRSHHRLGRRNTPYWYFLQCKAKIKEGKLAEALKLFEVKMLQEERLKPDESNYTVLIGGCGRAGYVKKAFRLYSDMKKRGLKPTDATYTALFNSCAESPWKDSGLEHALKLREELRAKNIQMNLITYQSLLKVCAKCSDLQSSLNILKEIVQKGHIVSTDTFNILLMGCIKDKEQGFRYSLQVWQKMLCLGIKPDARTYNLILRATRDCSIGDPAMTSDLLLSSVKAAHRMSRPKQVKNQNRVNATPEWDVELLEQQFFLRNSTDPKECDSRSVDMLSEKEPNQKNRKLLSCSKDLVSLPLQALTTNSAMQPPNLLDLLVNTDMVVSLGIVSSPSDRLALIGGIEGIIQKMHNDKVSPTIKTFTLLAEVMKPDRETESALICIMDSLHIQADLAFFNTLVRKRSKLLSLKSAKRGIAPDIKTFCNLAIACHRKEDGLQLLEDMTISGVLPNTYIYSTLINVAVKQLDYVYLTDILRDMKRRNVAPNQVVIRQLEFAAQYPPTFDRYKCRNVFLEKIDGFRGYYNRWLEWMAVDETSHPWEKYRTKVKPKEHEQGTSTE